MQESRRARSFSPLPLTGKGRGCRVSGRQPPSPRPSPTAWVREQRSHLQLPRTDWARASGHGHRSTAPAPGNRRTSPPAQVGQPLVGQLVGVAAVGGELAPPDRQRHDHAGPRPVRHARLQPQAAAIVEHGRPDRRRRCRARAASRGWISRCGSPSASRRLRHVDESRVQEVAGRRRDHRQRKAPRQLRRAVRILVAARRNRAAGPGPARQARRGELAASARRRKAARRRTARTAMAHSAATSLAARTASQPYPAVRAAAPVKACAAICSSLSLEARLGETHARRQRAGRSRVFGIASPSGSIAGLLATTYRWPYERVHVEVLELRGGRQHVVGVVGGVGQEVLEHHGEQVLAREPARPRCANRGATATGLLL